MHGAAVAYRARRRRIPPRPPLRRQHATAMHCDTRTLVALPDDDATGWTSMTPADILECLADLQIVDRPRTQAELLSYVRLRAARDPRRAHLTRFVQAWSNDPT